MGEGQGHLRHSKHKFHTRRLTGTPTSVNQESALWQPQYRAEKSISHWLGHCSLIKVPRPLWKLEGEQIGCPDWDSAASFFFKSPSLTFLTCLHGLCRTCSGDFAGRLCHLGSLPCAFFWRWEEQVQIMDSTAWYCHDRARNILSSEGTIPWQRTSALKGHPRSASPLVSLRVQMRNSEFSAC